MKLFHTENGKKVVYVQMQDIMYLNYTDISIPISINRKVFKPGVSVIKDSNRFNFVRFDEETEVKFFEELQFIIDYDEYKNFTDEQFEKEKEKIGIRLNEINNKFNDMTEEEIRLNMYLIEEYENLEYMLLFLDEIYSVKNGERRMPFPDFVEIPKKPQNKSFFSRFFSSRKM